MKVTLFTWGNPARGDDGAGPWLADRLRHLCNESVTLVEDFQLQVEHLLDCREADLMLFLDAHCEQAENFRFEEVRIGDAPSYTSHALSPGELLSYYARTFRGETPAPAFALTVPGSDFELGHPMSSATRSCCAQAAEFIESLLQSPGYERWQKLSRGRTGH